MKTRRALIAAICLAALLAIYAATLIIQAVFQENDERSQYDDIRSFALQEVASPAPNLIATEKPTTSATPALAPWYDSYARTPDKAIDFDALHELNPMIYAWITIEGTKIDYPIVHAPEKGDPTYLTRNAALEAATSGAIYTDGFNAIGLTDPLTLIYGHNMKDGSMFANLHKFQDAAFFHQHRLIKIYLDDVMLCYEIVAAYRTGDDHILALNDFTDPARYQQYLDGIDKTRDIHANFSGKVLDAGNRLITLCTCVGDDDQARYFVQGALLKSTENPEVPYENE
jgi:sortase B